MLVDVKDMISALGMNPALIGQATDAFTNALSNGQVRLEAEIGCSLTIQQCKDLFGLNKETRGPMTANGQVYRLRLKKPFVSVTPTPVISTSTGWNGEYTALTDNYRVDYQGGYVLLDADLVGDEGLFVQVEYQSGWADAETCPPMVKHAIVAYALQAMKLSSDETVKNISQGTPSNVIAKTLVEQYLRINGTQFYPFLSEATDV
jgi:hypothetical protein